MNKKQAFKVLQETYPQLKEGEKTNVSRIANKFLQVNFITKRKQKDANDYRFVLAYKEVFQALLTLLDFELHIAREDEVSYITNESDYNRLGLKKSESVLTLALRIIYQRKKDLITLDEDLEIFLYELHEELTRVGYLDGKRITKAELKPALQLLRRYNVIDYIDQGLADDARIKIYPTILYVTDLGGIADVIQQFKDYIEGVSDQDEETNEN